MGRRRDHKNKGDARIEMREYTDPYTRDVIKIATINAGTYIRLRNIGAKLPSKWNAQTISRQRGRKSNRYRVNPFGGKS